MTRGALGRYAGDRKRLKLSPVRRVSLGLSARRERAGADAEQHRRKLLVVGEGRPPAAVLEGACTHDELKKLLPEKKSRSCSGVTFSAARVNALPPKSSRFVVSPPGRCSPASGRRSAASSASPGASPEQAPRWTPS